MILRSLWTRPMLASPMRLAATVGGVAIGVACVVSTALASRAAVAFLGEDVEVVAGQARLEITRPGGIAIEDLGSLRGLCGEALMVPVVESSAVAPALGDLVRLLGVDLLVDGEGRDLALDLSDASSSSATGRAGSAYEELMQGRGVALSRGLAGELGVGLGETLELLVRSRPVALQVALLFEPERFDSVWDRVVLMDVGLAQELLEQPERYDRLELRPRLALDEAEFAERVAQELPEGYSVAPVSKRRAEGERLVRALDFNLTALSGVSLLVGMVLVATTLATSVVQRRKMIALLRSLGASRKQLTQALLLEAGTIGLFGGALGVLLGWIGARLALGSVRLSVASIAQGYSSGSIALHPTWVIGGLSLGLVSSLAAAILPLREALRTPPIQGLRFEAPESVTLRTWKKRALTFALLSGSAFVFAQLPPPRDRPIWALVSTLLLLSTLLVLSAPMIDLLAGVRFGSAALGGGTSLRVAQAALEAGRRRAAWAAGAVGVAVGLAVAMTTMVGSFRQSVVDWTHDAMRSDIFVRPLPTKNGVPAGTIDPEVVVRARDLFGHEQVEPFHAATAYVDGQAVSLGGAAFEIVAPYGGVSMLGGRPSADVFRDVAARGGAIVNEPFARRFDVQRGDRIELNTPVGTVEREVKGVYRDYSGHTGRVLLDLADFLEMYPDEGPQSIAVFLPDEPDLVGARRRFADALGADFAVQMLLNSEVRTEVLGIFERTFAVTIALQLVASVVASLAVVTVLSALLQERRRELALVRVLGGSRVQVAGIVLWQALLLGLAGALGGSVVGLIVGYVLVTIVNVQSFGWTLSFVPPWGSIAWTAGAVIPACVLAGIVPALLSLRATPQEGLREAA